MSVERTLKTLLMAGETGQVIRALTALADQIGDNSLMNDVVSQATRFDKLQQEKAAGLLHPSSLDHRIAQVHHALLLIIDQLADRLR